MRADAQRAVDRVPGGLFGTLRVERPGLPLLTPALGLLDGFNPCAMWVLLFLLTLLVHLHDRTRMALIAGTFLLVSCLVYCTFMAAWLNLFLLAGRSRPLPWPAGPCSGCCCMASYAQSLTDAEEGIEISEGLYLLTRCERFWH